MRKKEPGIGASKPLAKKLREKRNHPPPQIPWIWLNRDFLESEAWRTAPINTRRVVERLMLEHMAHAGTENGNLPCTYDDFMRFGVWRRYIGTSIRDAATRGLIIITQKGRASAGENRWPSKYALGWLPMRDGAPASNNWKAWTRPKSISPSAQSSTGKPKVSANPLVHKCSPVPVHKSPLGNDANQPSVPSAQMSTTYKISSERGTELDTHTVADPTDELPDLPAFLDRRKLKPKTLRRTEESIGQL